MRIRLREDTIVIKINKGIKHGDIISPGVILVIKTLVTGR